MEATELKYDLFWKRYVVRHRNGANQLLHAIGVALALCALIAAFVTRDPLWAAMAPVAGFSCAWLGHAIFERRRPLSWENPIFAVLCGLRMLLLCGANGLSREIGKQTTMFHSRRSTPQK